MIEESSHNGIYYETSQVLLLLMKAQLSHSSGRRCCRRPLSHPLLPVLSTGVRLHPMTWDEAAAAINDGSTEALATLGRLPLEIKSYNEFRSTNILGKYASVTDYLLATIFSCDCAPNEGRD